MGRGEGVTGSDCLIDRYRGVFWGDENVLELERINWLFAQHCECTKCHQTIYFKMVYFMLREFHLKRF